MREGACWMAIHIPPAMRESGRISLNLLAIGLGEEEDLRIVFLRNIYSLNVSNLRKRRSSAIFMIL